MIWYTQYIYIFLVCPDSLANPDNPYDMYQEAQGTALYWFTHVYPHIINPSNPGKPAQPNTFCWGCIKARFATAGNPDSPDNPDNPDNNAYLNDDKKTQEGSENICLNSLKCICGHINEWNSPANPKRIETCDVIRFIQYPSETVFIPFGITLITLFTFLLIHNPPFGSVNWHLS